MALKNHLQSILAVLSIAIGRASPASTSRGTQTPQVRPVITWDKCKCSQSFGGLRLESCRLAFECLWNTVKDVTIVYCTLVLLRDIALYSFCALVPEQAASKFQRGGGSASTASFGWRGWRAWCVCSGATDGRRANTCIAWPCHFWSLAVGDLVSRFSGVRRTLGRPSTCS